MLLDLAVREASGDPKVASNACWLANAPIWTYRPFKTLLLSRFSVTWLPKFSHDVRRKLANILLILRAAYVSPAHMQPG